MTDVKALTLVHFSLSKLQEHSLSKASRAFTFRTVLEHSFSFTLILKVSRTVLEHSLSLSHILKGSRALTFGHSGVWSVQVLRKMSAACGFRPSLPTPRDAGINSRKSTLSPQKTPAYVSSRQKSLPRPSPPMPAHCSCRNIPLSLKQIAGRGAGGRDSRRLRAKTGAE